MAFPSGFDSKRNQEVSQVGVAVEDVARVAMGEAKRHLQASAARRIGRHHPALGAQRLHLLVQRAVAQREHESKPFRELTQIPQREYAIVALSARGSEDEAVATLLEELSTARRGNIIPCRGIWRPLRGTRRYVRWGRHYPKQWLPTSHPL